jgi:hypothetical protein
MKIKDLPEPIKKRALECQKEQGNEPNEELELANGRNHGNFWWDETKECSIWDKVDNGNFHPFYNFHNMPILTRSQIAEKFGITGDFEIID